MTAYELADELLRDNTQLTVKAAYMLRQQADRIAELEKLLEQSIGSDCREMRYIQEIENKDARIAELEDKLSFYEIKDLDSGLKPKPLSDEEINQIWRTVLADSLSWHGLQKKTTVDIEFARAIEAKVRGEK